ncbi:MAG: hypothetical protein K2X38_19825 [Gemmataceae bacterium]|nr:hypothetical protein [Gemmataceae bacterium]
MTRYFGVFVIFCVSVAPAAAQVKYKGKDFEKFISNELKKEFTKKSIKGDVTYSISGGFRVLFDADSQKLEFFEKYTYELPPREPPKNGKVEMAAKLAAWNTKASHSAAKEVGFTQLKDSKGSEVGTLHDIRFQGVFDLKKMGASKLKDYYEKLDLEFEDFVIYMQDLLKHDKKGKASSALPSLRGDCEQMAIRRTSILLLPQFMNVRRDELQ